MLFFATREDLLAMADHVEQVAPLDYVRFGHQPTPRVARLASARGIPGLGMADAASAAACETWLVVPRDGPVVPRLIRHVDGPTYSIDQTEDNESITFSAGGLWRDTLLLHGWVATVAGAPMARRLLQRFESHMRKRFEKIGAYRVSPGAAARLDSGFRLCMAEQSPPTHDLRRPS